MLAGFLGTHAYDIIDDVCTSPAGLTKVLDSRLRSLTLLSSEYGTRSLLVAQHAGHHIIAVMMVL